MDAVAETLRGERMSDLISRQAAIDALNGLCDRECEYSKEQRYVMCGACHLGSAFDVIEQLPSAEPEWIPVSERLPKETGLYLISLNTKGVGLFEETHPDGFVYVSAYDAVIMHWGYGDKNVQAWMPLPESYVEVDHD